MKINRFVWLIGLLAVCGMNVPCNAGNTHEKVSERAPHIQFEETDYDFGQVQEGTQVTHIYTFKNVGIDTLMLGKIRTSCGCTGALVSDRKIAPGGEGEIKVTFDTKNYRGKSRKTVTVHSNDPDRPQVQLAISCEILVEFELVPRYVNFGTIEKGEERSRSVKVRFPSDPTQWVTKVESMTRGIHARQVPSKSTKPGETEIRIRVNKEVPVGRLSGQVLISTTSPTKPTDTIMVVAHVRGEIAVQPSALTGVFRKGDPKAIRSISLTKKGKKDLKIEKVEEDTGRFAPHVVQVKEGEDYRVEIFLRADAEPGPFRGTLKIHTNDPNQRIIEVRLYGRVE